MSKRSNLLVVVGLAVFLLGAAVVLITTHGSSSSASSGSVSVLVARQNIAAGTAGDQVLAGNLVETKNVKPGDVSPGALGAVAQLSGRTLSVAVPAGQQITETALGSSGPAAPAAPTAPVGATSIQVPAGKQALAVQIPFVAGGAQLVSPGTFVNIYVNDAKGGQAALPCTELAFPNIQVLAASTAQSSSSAAPAAPGAAAVPAAGPDIVYVLAVDPGQAQALIFFAKNESLYMTVVPKNQPAASTTACTGYQDFVRK